MPIFSSNRASGFREITGSVSLILLTDSCRAIPAPLNLASLEQRFYVPLPRAGAQIQLDQPVRSRLCGFAVGAASF
jgi:hypothetical protein